MSENISARWRAMTGASARVARRTTKLIDTEISLRDQVELSATLTAHELSHHVQLKPFVVALGTVLFHRLRVHFAGDLHQPQEHFLAVGQVLRVIELLGGSHGFDVEPDTATRGGIVRPFEHPDGVEGTAEVH